MAREQVSSRWTIRRFLARLASSESTPGGGSAAALSGALGCSLAGMVGRILLSRPRAAKATTQRLQVVSLPLAKASRARLQRDMKRADRLAAKFQALIREDADAYCALLCAQRADKGIAQARKRAIQTPIAICETAVEAARLIRAISPLAGPYLGSDLKAGRALLRGAFESALTMAAINIQGPDPDGHNKKIRRTLTRLQKRIQS